jgi:hypothetical protein
MYRWFFTAKPNRAGPAFCVHPQLETLEDRCLPSAGMMPANPPMSTATPTASTNTIASLPHEQIHVLQDQFHQQTQLAIIRLEVEQVVLGLLQQFAPQAPQFQSLITSLTSAIPMHQATVQMLQDESDLLDKLDDLQDQVLILNGVIQNGSPLVAVLRQLGDEQAANALAKTILTDQASVQTLQPQIETVEVEVSAFV